MGKGDRRTRRGKIYNGSYGKKRPGKLKKGTETGASTSTSGRPGPGRGR
jgi:30S ribosomal protein S31